MTALAPPIDYEAKWRAFTAIGVAFVTNVAAMSMVFVALPAIADDFEVTLRSASWIVIVQSLTISSLLLPMGRVADMVGRRRIHLAGLGLFGVGALAVAAAPSFGLLIVARIVMSIGNAMGQSVGTSMVVAVFPPSERGKAIGSQTTAVAIGSASGPIVAGLILEILPWRAMFLLLTIPVAVAFVVGYIVLTDERVSPDIARPAAGFDWGGAVLSALLVTALVLTINNPLGVDWLSAPIWLGVVGVVILAVAWIRWERRAPDPMLDLSMFSNRVFALGVVARQVGFMGSTVVYFMAPVFLISLRGLTPAQAGGIMFVNSLGLGIAAQTSGRLSDRFGTRPFGLAGFTLAIAMALVLSSIDRTTPIVAIMVVLFFSGISMGSWNVPNNSSIIGAVPASRHGVVGALTNLVRNLGNVTGQALASGVIVGVMVARGFDIPLSEIGDSMPAGDAFLAGWQWSFRIVAVLAAAGLVATALSRPEHTEI